MVPFGSDIVDSRPLWSTWSSKGEVVETRVNEVPL